MSFQTIQRKTLFSEANQVLTKTKLEKFFPHISDFDPLVDIRPDEFKRAYLNFTVFDKYVALDSASSLDRERACMQKYLACEAKCKETNAYFDAEGYKGTKIHHLLMLTRKYLNDILGSFPSTFLDHCAFGPGASTRLSRPFVDVAFKLEGVPHCTSLLWSLLDGRNPFEHVFPKVEIRECAKYHSVPKSSVINRPIEIQPDLNMFFQKSLGNIIRQRMKNQYTGAARRLDLNDQTLNQELAKLGSMDGVTCTLDLSSASDTISTNFVKYIIDDTNWLGALYATRVGLVEFDDGRILPLEKFSAMGNGYTWELQSAIFYSMIRASNEYHGMDGSVAAVYGDDIICHKDVADTLCDFLSACGLTVNKKKSFVSGYFRESCGKHYYKGYDVTPCYVRKPLETNQEVVNFHNRLFDWMSRDGFKDVTYLPALNALKEAMSCEPLHVPVGKGDCGLHACGNDLRYKTFLCKSTHEHITVFKCYDVYRSVLHWCGIGSYRKALLIPTVDDRTAADIPFGNQRVRVRKMKFTSIPTFGSWC